MQSHKGFRPIVIIFLFLSINGRASPVSGSFKMKRNDKCHWCRTDLTPKHMMAIPIFVYVFLFLFSFGYQNLLSTQCASIINIELGEKYLTNPQLLNTKTKSLNCITKPLNCQNERIGTYKFFFKVSTNLVIDAIAKCYRRKHVRHKVQCGGVGLCTMVDWL